VWADVASVGELGDELRRIAAGLPCALLMGAVTLLESAQQQFTAVLCGSSQYEATELLGLLEQALQAVRQAQQMGHAAQAAVQAFADKTGTGSAEGTAGSGSGTGVRPRSGTGSELVRPSGTARQSAARSWKTIAEEVGSRRVFSSYAAAKRALGSRPGQEIHHLVEQSQALPARSGFKVSRINTTDNLVWVPAAVHRRISAFYSSKPPGMDQIRRNSMNGLSWDDQYRLGLRAMTRAWKEYERDE
jgi:hypothetical protein